MTTYYGTCTMCTYMYTYKYMYMYMCGHSNKGIRVPHVRDAIHMWSTRIVQKWKKKNSLEYKSLSSMSKEY